MSTIFIKPSKRKFKKFNAFSDDGLNVNFGDRRYKDYTQNNNDKDRRSKYRRRHYKRENWDDDNTAGFWSTHLLWNKPTLEESAQDIERILRRRVVLLI
jgi:hypothetical protein